MPIARFAMPDGRVARFEVPEGLSPEEAQDLVSSSIAKQEQKSAPAVAPTEAAPVEKTERTFGGTLKDIGISALSGFIGLPQSVVGLADIPTGGAIGRGLESLGYRPEEAKKFLKEEYSPAQKEAFKQVSEAKGFIPTLQAAVRNPSTILQSATESIPQMLGGMGIARGVMAAAPKLSAAVAGGLGEGILGAGSAAEQIREESPDKLLAPLQSLAALGSGAGTAAFGILGGKIAGSKLGQRIGLNDVDTMLARGGAGAAEAGAAKAGFIRSVIGSGISEGVLEELPQSMQEKMWQNWATNKPLMEGVSEAGAMGLITGAAVGAVGGGYGNLTKTYPAQPPPPPPEAPQIDPDKYSAVIKGLTAAIPDSGLTDSSKLGEIFKASGIENEAEVSAYLNQAITSGEIVANSNPVFNVTDANGKVLFNTVEKAVADKAAERLNAEDAGTATVEEALATKFTKPTGMPQGVEVRAGQFKRDMFNISRGDTILNPEPLSAEDVGQKAYRLSKITAGSTEANTKEIEVLQKKIDTNNTSKEKLEAAGEALSPEYATLSAQVNENNALIQAQIDEVKQKGNAFSGDISITPAKESEEGFTLFKQGKPAEYFKTEEDLNQALAAEPTAGTTSPKPEALDAAREALREKLLPFLKQVGLENTGLRIMDSIENGQGSSDGAYAEKLISISMQAANPMGTLRHETIHALKELGAFTKQEWSLLESYAKKQWVNQFLRQRKIGDSNYYDTYKKIYLETNPSIAGFDEYIIEEAIADAFKYFNATKPPANIIGNIYRKVKALLEGLGNQLSGLGFQTADDVFKRVEAGQMKPTRQGETGAAPRYALNPKQKEAALIKRESVPLAIVSANPGAGRYEQGNFSYKGTTVDEATQDFAKLASGLVTKYAAENSGEENTSKWERVAKDSAADEIKKNGVQLLRDYYKQNKVSASDISKKTSGLSNAGLSNLFDQIRGSINADFGSAALPSYLQRTAKVGDKTANQINKENIHAKAVELLQTNKKWIAKEFGLKNLQFPTVRGSFERNPELSFIMTADNMTTDVANKLALFLGVGFVQDQVVHRIPIDVTDENQFVIPSAIITNKNLSKISEEDATKFIAAAKKIGLDYTEAIKGDGFVFHYFGDKSEIGDWNQALQKISQESGLNNVISFDLSSDLYDANLPKGYTGEGREEGSGEDRSKDATTGSPVYAGSSWKLLVDKFLAPYVKSISGEGYRVSPDRFALRYGLNEAQTQYLREALYPKSTKGSVASVLYDGEIVNVLPSKAKETKPSISDVGSILANRSTVQGQVEPGDHSEKARKAVAAVFADEVKRRIERENIEGSPESLKKAQGWYEKTLKIALEKMSSIFPELSVDAKGNPTNKQARFLFNGILAITSQGMDVVANFKAAATYYGSIRRAETNFLTFGKINPQHAPNLLGDKHNAIEWNLKKFQEIIDELGGWKEAEALMLNKSTVKELNKLVSTKLKNLELYNDEGKLTKVKVAGAAERVSRGWSLFGPKIGSFANNLYGDFSTLTADLWFSRTWNRVLGFVYRKDATLEAKQMMAFRSAIEKEFSDTWRQSGSGEWKLTKHGLDEVFRYDRAAKSVVEKEKDMAALQDSASRDYNAASDKLKNIEEKWKSEGFTVNKKINSDPALAKIYADLKEIKRQEKLKMSLKKSSDAYKRDVTRINKEKKHAVNTQKSHFSWIGNSLPEKIQENLNGDPDNLFDFASALHTEYAGAQFYRRTPLNAAAKNFFENSSKLVAAPRSVSEGLFQQEVIEDARDILKNELGINVEIADLQALLWFQEKDIYRKFGAANSKAAPADYSDAADQTITNIKNGNLNIEEKSYISPSLKKVGGKQSLQDTVYIDGVNRPTTNSSGRPIFGTLEGIKNFWRGFDESKIVDKEGRPLLMYHGTTPPEDSEGIFSQFRSSDDGKMGKGIYTTSIEKYAESFAPSGAVMPLYISMNNPFYINLTSKVIEGKSARTLLREQISGESKDTFDKNYFRLDSRGSQEINNALNNEIQSITDGKRLMDMSGISIQRALKKAGYDGIVVKDSEGNFVEVNAFDSEQVKSATGNRGTFSPKSKDIRYSITSPVWYSELSRQIDKLPQKEMTAAEWKALLVNPAETKSRGVRGPDNKVIPGKFITTEVPATSKLPGVKLKEIDDTEILEWLDVAGTSFEVDDYIDVLNKKYGVKEAKGPYDVILVSSAWEDSDLTADELRRLKSAQSGGRKNTKISTAEVQQFLADGGSKIEFQDRVLGTKSSLSDAEERQYRKYQEMAPDEFTDDDLNNYTELEKRVKTENTTKFDAYNLPGGTNYREAFVTVPNADSSGKWVDGHGAYSGINNPVVRIRFNDRVDAEGKKVLFLEELQPPNNPEFGKMPKSLQDRWLAIGLKRMIRHAAEGDYDKIAWTTGEQQVERYASALRESVDSIEWEKTPEGVHIKGYKVSESGILYGMPEEVFDNVNAALRRNDQLGFDTISQARRGLLDDGLGTAWLDRWDMRGAPAEDIAAMQAYIDAKLIPLENTPKLVADTTYKETDLTQAIGKLMADRIRNDPSQTGTIEGEDLSIDSVGVKKLYDVGVPALANKILKELGGGKVGEIELPKPKQIAEKIKVAVYPGEPLGRYTLVNRDGMRVTEEIYPSYDSATAARASYQQSEDALIKPNKQPAFDITPPLREKAMSGVPRYSISSSSELFDPKEIEKHSETKFKKRTKLIDMNIDDFLHLATPGQTKSKEADVEEALNSGAKLRDLPSMVAYQKNGKGDLIVDGNNEPSSKEINNHEGRHRARALKKRGYTTMPVLLTTNIRFSEQQDPDKFDYIKDWPKKIIGYDGNTVAFPVKREDAEKDYQASEKKYSLRDDFITKFGQADLTNLNSKTHVREEVGYAKRLAAAFSPDSRVKLRAQIINRLEAIERQTMKVSVDPRYGGSNELLADVSATAAALQSQRASGIAAESFKRGVPVYAKGFTSVSDLNGTVKGLIPIFQPLLDKYKDPMIWQIFQFYSATRRGERFAGEGREKLFTAADIQKGKDYGVAYPEFDAVFKDYQKYNEGLVKFQVDTGVLTPELGRKWMMYSDYIPFYRQLNGEETLGPKLFQNFSGVKPTPILKGSDAKIADFLETIIHNSRSAIENGMKNVAVQRIARDAMRTNSPGMTDMARKLLPYEKDAADVIHVRENGIDVRYKVADILLVEAMKGLGTTEMGSVLKFMSYPTKVLRDLVTKDPGFMLANLFRDSAQAYVTSGTNMIPIIDTFKQAAKILANQSPEAKALMAAGIGGGYEFSGDVKASAKAVSAALNEKAGIKTGWQKALWPVSKVWSALEAGTTASDLATRSEIYARVMKSTNGNEAEAVYQALEVMNFGRMGSSPIIQVISALVPFFNARVQGLDVLYRAGTGRLASASAKTQQKLFARRAMYIMGMSIAYWMLARDTDEWKRASKETRDNNWIIGSVKVPIPFEIGTIFKVLPERILEYTFGNDTGSDLADSAFRNISSTLKMVPVPQAVLPLVEAYWIDYSFFTGNGVVGRGMEKLDPQFQLREGTSLVAKKMGDITGMSPVKIDHVLQGYTGAMGMYVASAISAMIRTEDDGAKASMSLEQTPILKRFFASDKAGGSIDAFYEFKKQVDMVVATQDELQKRGNPEQYIEYMKTNGKLLGAKQIVSNIGDKLSEMRKLRNIVNFSKSMPPDQKRETLDNIRMAEIKLTESIKGIRAMVTQ